jgi:hypothetical protein
MSNINDGGPAFPSPGVVLSGNDGNPYQQGAYGGMTMRDYFAKGAMEAILGSEEAMDRVGEQAAKKNLRPAAIVAKMAFNIAGEMLKERAK